MKILALNWAAAAAALFGTAPALAQADPAAFTGPRVEATIGLSQLRFDLDQVGGDGRTKSSDLGYGGAVGYDVALSPGAVIGGEFGVNLSDNSLRIGDGTTGGALRQRRELTVAGRIGVPIFDRALLYGKIGYANLQVRDTITTGGVGTGALRDLDGVLLGAGVEVPVWGKAYIKSEYRYTDYADGYIANNIMTGFGLRF